MADIFVTLGHISGHLGKYAEAIEAYSRALDIRIHTVGPEDDSVAELNRSIGETYFFRFDNFRDAVPYLEEAYRIQSKLRPNDHETGKIAVGLAICYISVGRYDDGLRLLLPAAA